MVKRNKPSEQLFFTDLIPTSNRGTIAERFAEFHAANPHVYSNLVILARRAYAIGRTKIGIAQLFEVLRWQHALATSSDAAYKLNNNFRAHYAREIMANEPTLAGVFDTRELRAA